MSKNKETHVPFRISFLGGGTDLDSYLNQGRTGVVLSTSLWPGISVRHRFEMKTFGFDIYSKLRLDIRTGLGLNDFISSSDLESIELGRLLKLIVEFKGPIVDDINFGVNGLVVEGDSSFPLGYGLGGSMSLITAICKELFPDWTSSVLVQNISKMFHQVGSHAGYQDQIAVNYPGTNLILMNLDEKKQIQYSTIPIDVDLNDNVILIDLNVSRFAEKILEDQDDRTKNSTENIYILDTIRELTLAGYLELVNGNLEEFGRLVFRSWQLKKELSSLICPVGSKVYKCDRYLEKEFVERGLIYGHKLLGAGGGGCFCLIVDSDNRQEVIENLEQDGLYNVVKNIGVGK